MDNEIRLLVIEDNPGDFRLIKEFLSEEKSIKFHLEHADRVSAGIERILKGGLDIIILDLTLPDSEGLNTFISVSAQAREIPVVVLTSINDESLAIKAVQDGAQDYLVKGHVERSLLVRAIRYAIERKKAQLLTGDLQEKLAHANKMAAIGTLTGGVAHKINNPLSIILMNIQLIREMIEKKDMNMEEISKLARRIENASVQAKKTVSDLLIFTREYEMAFKPVNLGDIVKSSLPNENELAQNNIKIAQDMKPGLPKIVANHEKLLVVFQNIIQNAVESMPKGGTITISAEAKDINDEELIEIIFADTGTGISEDALSKVFDPFYTTKDMGSGLGLCIAKGIVTAHKGGMKVESQVLKIGTYEADKTPSWTKVIITLPIAK